jgi:redox-sensitive bicupin YhaK (pirin superfamily)
MEIQVRLARERGHADHGWLDTSHTFSFADYYDPQFMGFRVLRVINEDIVAPGRGFGTHGHRDMEIITYVLEGELGHKDNMGNGSTIKPGEVQRMSAGTGVMHSEMNASKKERVHFMQIWIIPDKQGHKPGYEQKAFSEAERRGTLRVVASPDGRNGSVTIHQDATLAVGLLAPGDNVEHTLAKNRYAWIQVARGSVEVEGHTLSHGDGASISGDGAISNQIRIRGVDNAEVLVFDLP